MPIPFRCGACGRTATVAERLAGRRVRCPGCGAVQRLVEPAAGADALGEPPAEPAGPAEAIKPAVAPRRSREPNWSALFRAGVLEPSRVQGLAVALLALSAADLFMTHTLLRAGRGVYEANPVARWFFARWNMAGMVGFKFAIIAGVIALAELIERRRPGRGKFVLLVGCLGAIYAVAVGLRIYLGLGAGAPNGGD